MKSQEGLSKAELEELRKEQERIQESGELGGGQKAAYWKPAVGRNVVRILPPKGKEKFYYGVRQHFVLSESGKKFPYICLRQDPKHQEPSVCPICQYVVGLAEVKDTKGVDDFRAKTRYYMNIIDRKEEDKGVQVWACGPKIFFDVLGIFLDPDWNMDITDPESGVDVIVTRVGTGKRDTKYTIKPRPRSTTVEFDLENLVDLRSLVLEASFEELEEVVKELEEKGAISGERRQTAEEEGKEKSQKRTAKEKKDKKEKHPKCFGRKFDGEDELCQECDYKEECEEIVRQGEKEEDEDEDGNAPKSLRDRMKK